MAQQIEIDDLNFFNVVAATPTSLFLLQLFVLATFSFASCCSGSQTLNFSSSLMLNGGIHGGFLGACDERMWV